MMTRTAAVTMSGQRRLFVGAGATSLGGVTAAACSALGTTPPELGTALAKPLPEAGKAPLLIGTACVPDALATAESLQFTRSCRLLSVSRFSRRRSVRISAALW